MLPRRFALIRHVDYSGGAGTGVIAYGVAFDDGQVVLRWSSAHPATSVLDSVEDLIAAHGHGETTSIEWIDAPPGKAEAPAPAGRRARRSTSPSEERSAADVKQASKPPATTPTEPVDAGPAHQPAGSDGPAHARPAARANPAAGPADAGAPSTDDPVQPAGSTPGQSTTPTQQTTPTQPATPAQPAAAAQPGTPEKPATAAPRPAAAEQPAAAARATEQPAANSTSREPAQGSGDSATKPNVAASLGVARLAQQASSGHEPDEPESATPGTLGHASPASNGAARLPDATHPAEPPFSRTAASSDDERRARHEAIATQPMSAELSNEAEPRRPRRAAPPTHQSPRSIFEEAAEPSRPDLRLASSNGQVQEPDEVDDFESESARRDSFGGFFSSGHQHLETVTGLLDLPAGLDKRGRGAESEQDANASRRNGRHRGE